RARRDEPQALRGAQAWRDARDRRPFRKTRRRHIGRQEPPPHRGKRAAPRSRGGGIQTRRRRRFLAPPRGYARLLYPTAEGQGGRRVRAQIPKADVSRRRAHRRHSLISRNFALVSFREGDSQVATVIKTAVAAAARASGDRRLAAGVRTARSPSPRR